MIRFGTAGLPHAAKGQSQAEGIRTAHSLGLEAMEVEFVYGVRMKPAQAREADRARQETGLRLTAHGPYYVNLASLDPQKKRDSIKRVMDTARMCALFGGESVTFHAAFYQGRDPDEVFEIVKQALQGITGRLAKENVTMSIRPEVTGKPSQFGSLEELIRLSQEVQGVLPCIDFAHLVARASGKGNSYKGFCKALEKLGEGLGESALGNLHMHLYGIEWGKKGEVRHVPLKRTKLRWKALLRALADMEASGVAVCESPLLEEDALALKKEYNRLIRKRGS